MRRACLAVCLAGLAGLGLALAGAPAVAQEIEGVCARDVERLCPNLERGRQLRKCIQERQSEFSPECKARMEELEGRRRAFREACADDIRTYCANTEGGRGRILRCLQAQQLRLSPECRTAVEQAAPEGSP